MRNSVPLHFPGGYTDRRLFDEEIVNSDEEQQQSTGEQFPSAGVALLGMAVLVRSLIRLLESP